jgi:hypothetical protein
MAFAEPVSLGLRQGDHIEGGDECLFDRLFRVMDEKTTAIKETKAHILAMTRDEYEDVPLVSMDGPRATDLSGMPNQTCEREHSVKEHMAPSPWAVIVRAAE